MRITKPVIPFRVPPQPIQDLHSGSIGKIDVPCIRCLGVRVPEAYELWALAKYGVYEVHLSARVRLLDNFREDTFHTHLFNARRFYMPFLGRRSVNMSVKFLDAARATQQVGSRVTSWTKNRFVKNFPVTPHALVIFV